MNSLFALQEILVNTGLIGYWQAEKAIFFSGYAIKNFESEYFNGRMGY